MLTGYMEYEKQLEAQLQKAQEQLKLGKYEDALDLIKKTKKSCEETDNMVLTATCNELAGIIYITQGNVVDGIKKLNEALSILEPSENYREVARIYNSMANGFAQLSLYTQANMYHSQALAIATKVNDERGIGYLNLNIAEDYLLMKQPKEAELYLKNAYKTFAQINEGKMIPACDYLQGVLFYEKKQYDKTKEFFNKAISGAEKTNDARTLSQIYEAYADLNKAESNFGEEQRNLELAVICYRKMDNHKKVMELMKRKGRDKDQKKILG